MSVLVINPRYKFRVSLILGHPLGLYNDFLKVPLCALEFLVLKYTTPNRKKVGKKRGSRFLSISWKTLPWQKGHSTGLLVFVSVPLLQSTAVT